MELNLATVYLMWFNGVISGQFFMHFRGFLQWFLLWWTL